MTKEKLFIQIYEEYMTTDIENRMQSYRYLGALEALWRLITNHTSDELPYQSYQVPRIFWFGSKVVKESYVTLILRLSEELCNELKNNQ